MGVSHMAMRLSKAEGKKIETENGAEASKWQEEQLREALRVAHRTILEQEADILWLEKRVEVLEARIEPPAPIPKQSTMRRIVNRILGDTQ